MPKLRHSKFVLVTALSGGMAALLACLLCWAYGWNPVWAGSLNLQPGTTIGNAEVSEPPAISSRAAGNSAEPPVAVPAQESGALGRSEGNEASSLPRLRSVQRPDHQPGHVAEHAANHAAEHPADHAANQPQTRQAELQHGFQPELAADQQGSPDSIALSQPDAESTGQPPAEELSQDAGNSASSAAANAPARGAPQASAPANESKVQLFGTIEFKRPLSSLPGWLDLLKRNQMDPIFIPGKVFKRGVTWDSFKAKAPVNNKMELLRYVNSFWNTWPYVEDIVNWGQEDYWEIPAEFLKKSGDCEDYSIIKYFTLKELSIPPENMRIVVVRDTVRNFAHAVLVVYLNGDAFILDNLSNSVLSHTKVRQYSPQYSVNEFGRWAHLKGRKIN